MDMDVCTLQNYKLLADMIPEYDSPKWACPISVIGLLETLIILNYESVFRS